MMMKGLVIQQPHSALDQENMSNLTSTASGEASVSDTNGGIYPHQQQVFANPNQSQPVKKKRNQPGNPDPDAEVIALSPKTLMATNRFVCEICNKGFQRDQNLQLHRRGHNLPWKLKQRSNKEVIRKKVYVCPEASCVHHEPARALGDLTGIKKHFCRKHGEKKWKCDKCSKRYAVQSDWKAHSKTCGTREYRCDCGTLFSRRDSFITHRAFCDALAEESARRVMTGSQIHHPSQPGCSSASNINFQFPAFQPPQVGSHGDHSASPAFPSVKKEQQHYNGMGISGGGGFNLRPEIPPWLITCQPLVGATHGPPPPLFHPGGLDFLHHHHQEFTQVQNPNPNNNLGGGPTLPPFHPTASSPQISATALLQRAAQMGATGIGSGTASSAAPAMLMIGPHTDHVSADQAKNLSSREAVAGDDVISSSAAAAPPHGGSLLHDITAGATSFSSSTTDPHGFDASSFEDPFGGINGANDDMTKDFLGLRPLSHSDIFNITSLVDNPASDHHHHHHHHQPQVQKAWPS
ncbi:PREDICTED: protein indeterminate-domain 7-like [Ipomoea nil]|uniref:protein indeterminate-domain 7-like n=1 Tax=Ipomoea nil TaxID=35883 RepID=UPI0009014E31|nr:PREDICTED: protein indeterminate-domain 7-like [Ipomoea nil]XP_019194403.1 PREDICTED: protein indeterminate-domain 7-like [Ipomoea nil]XP_019194404.1 PREDICTED: protein indeterminate-domain 7-like [Ipomoea nil]XP_019194405.1 PREDICTED: protein indeterminate-domain 7-like [Ipomoea nil]XP_019194406.1 PREDICTED: protein indeterminate-domain 7-like [Ipomoea nil]